jgi:hypothetical protein
MPAVIPFAIQAIGTAFAVSATTVAVATVAATLSVAAYQKRRAQKKAIAEYNKSLSDRLVMVATSDAARSIALGRVRASDGVLFKGSYGSKKEFYTLVVALAGHEIDGIEQIYFNDLPITLSGDLVTSEPYGKIEKQSKRQTFTAVPSTSQTVNLGEAWIAGTLKLSYVTGSGGRSTPLTITGTSGTSATFDCPAGATTITANYQISEQRSYARVYQYLGAAGQDLSALLETRFPDLITPDHRFDGIACLVVDFSYDTTPFPSGLPAVTALFRGAKVLDTRTSITAWSDNPALCARHVALHPWLGGAESDEIDEAAVIAAANACDISHTYTDSNGVSTTRAMFKCSYVASTDVSANLHMDELAEAMAGKWGWAGGRVRMRAGVYTAPVAHITDDWLTEEGRQISPGPGQADLVNVMRPTISDAAQAYVATPIAPVRAGTYIAADGREMPQETTLSAVAFAPQAQHVCAIQMREMRQGMVLNWPVKLMGFGLELFDVVTLTSSRYGFASKPFEVLGCGLSPSLTVPLTLKETGASIYQPDDEFPAGDPEPNTSLPQPWDIPAITGLTIASGTDELLLQDDGTIVSRVLLTFDPVEREAVLNGGTIEVGYKLDTDDDWQYRQFDGALTSIYLTGLQDQGFYVFKARARSQITRGDWSEQVYEYVEGKTAQPEDVTGLTATATTGGILIEWNASTELDRASTELRLGASWGASTLIENVAEPVRQYLMAWPADGTYSILARRRDTTGNESASTATASITVAGQDIAIETDQIKDNAATEVSTANTDFPVTIGSVHTIPDGSSSNDSILGLFPNRPNPARLIMTVEIDVEYTTHASTSTIGFWYSLQDSSGFDDAYVSAHQEVVGAGVTKQFQVTAKRAFNVPAGLAGPYSLRVSKNDLFDTVRVLRQSATYEWILK